MPVSKIHSDNQIAGGTLNLGGDLSAFGFGSGHVGKVVLRNVADVISVTLDASGTSGTGSNKMVVINGNSEILGRLDASGGVIKIPQGTTLPSSGEQEGDMFWKTDANELYIYNGAAWQLLSSSISALGSLTLNGREVSSKSTGWVEIMGLSVNLRTLFPLFDFKLQAKAWMSGAGTGEIRLYNFTDVVQVPNAIINISSVVPSILEATSASTPIDAQKEYALEFRKTSGVGAINVFVRGAILRRI